MRDDPKSVCASYRQDVKSGETSPEEEISDVDENQEPTKKKARIAKSSDSFPGIIRGEFEFVAGDKMENIERIATRNNEQQQVYSKEKEEVDEQRKISDSMHLKMMDSSTHEALSARIKELEKQLHQSRENEQELETVKREQDDKIKALTKQIEEYAKCKERSRLEIWALKEDMGKREVEKSGKAALIAQARNVKKEEDQKVIELERQLMVSIQRSNNLHTENESLKMVNIELKEENRNLKKQESAVRREIVKRDVAQMMKEDRANNLSAYSTMRNHQYKTIRKDTVIREVKRISGGEDPTKLINDTLARLGTSDTKTILSDYEAFLIYHDCGMTRASYTKLRRCFKKKGVHNPLPPLRGIIEMELKYGSSDTFHVRKLNVMKSKDNRSYMHTVVIVELKNLQGYLNNLVQEYYDNQILTFDASTGGNIWISILGDKGGDEFKLSLAIGNLDSPNSAYRLIPLALFTDDETAENVVKFLSHSIEQVDDLKNITIEIDGEPVDIPISFFLVGDLKFLYEMVGHQGAASKFHCLYCYHHDRGLISQYVRGEDVPLRTAESYADDALRQTTRKNGVANHARRNVKAESSFVFKKILLSSVVPPSLHEIMGIGQKYGFDALIRRARQMDNKSGRKLEKTKLATERKSKALVIELETREKEFQEHRKLLEMVFKVLEKFSAKAVESDEITEEHACDANWCLFRDKTMRQVDPRLVECANCDNTFHALCLGSWSLEDWGLARLAHTDSFCFHCTRTTEDKIQKEAMKQLQVIREEEAEIQKELAKEREIYKNRVEAAGGHLETMKRLENTWKSLGADMSAWQSNFVGNHVLKLLEPDAIATYLAVFPPSQDLSYMRCFLEALGKLQKLCVTRSLTDDEIIQIEKHIVTLAIKYALMLNFQDTIWCNLQLFAPNESLTPKLHVLLEHVVPFVKRHRTWAKTSEQSIEAVHALVNRLKTKYCFLRNPEEKYSQICRSLLYHNKVKSSG